MKQSTVDRITQAIVDHLHRQAGRTQEPALYAATALHVGPNDVVVLHLPSYTTPEQALATKAKAIEVFGTHRVLIISKPSSITVASFDQGSADERNR